MNLVNLMEKEVEAVTNEVVKGMKDICHCEKCKLDIIALVLNKLPARYVVTTKGYAYSKASTLNYQFSADIITAVTNAINIVAKNPRHDEE